MTAAGEQVLAVAYSQVGVTEQPPNSNNVPYWDAWGGNYGAWCAAFVSWCDTNAGYPLPPIDGAPGFSYCPSGQIAAYTTGHAVGSAGAEPGDTVIFSWEPWHMAGGIAICSYGSYAGAPAGDHTGFFAGWLGGSYLRTVEGNTSQSSWDNGGAVMERTDRYDAQICCYARHAALGAGGGGGGGEGQSEMTEGEWARMATMINDTVVNVWRAQEVYNGDVERAQFGAHYATLGIVRSPEFDQIVQRACMSAITNTGLASAPANFTATEYDAPLDDA